MKKFLAVATAAVLMLMSVSAFAYSVKVDDDTFASVGAKALIQVQAVSGPDQADHVMDVVIPNARLYTSGQITNTFKFGLNFDMTTGRTATATTRTAALADGFVLLDFAKEFKVMTGMYRMAVTRVALQDTYTYITPTAPEVAGAQFLSSGERSGFRSAGITAWGDLMNGMLRYNVGVWDGDYSPAPGVVTGASNREDQPGLSARFVVNFLDPEKGYTCAECYLGKAKIANIGIGYLTQDYVTGTGATQQDRTYTVTTVDGYYDADNLTVEAAYYSYDFDNASATVAGRTPTGMFLAAAYAFGNIQPALRYETWDSDTKTGTTADFTKTTLAVNYLMDGHNAKISLEYAMKAFDTETATQKDTTTTTLQMSLQF